MFSVHQSCCSPSDRTNHTIHEMLSSSEIKYARALKHSHLCRPIFNRMFSTNCNIRHIPLEHYNLRNRLIILYTSQSPRWDPPANVALWLPESWCLPSAPTPPSHWAHGASSQPNSDDNMWPGRIGRCRESVEWI